MRNYLHFSNLISKTSWSGIIVIFICLFSINVNGQITVTSGGAGLAGSYTSLTKAGGLFQALNTNNQAGQTILITVDGNVTNEDGVNSLTGAAGMWTSLKFVPSGARTLSGTVAQPLIDLNGADAVTFDGLNSAGNSLTIANLSAASTSTTSTFRFIGDATGNTITNCNVLGSSTAALGTLTGNIIFASAAITTGNDNNTVSNCNLGPVGSNLPTKLITFTGSSNTDPGTANSGIILNNNNFFDWFSATAANGAIDVNSGTVNLTISNNRFYQTASRTITAATTVVHSGVRISNSSGFGYSITGNTFGYASNTQTGNYTIVFPTSTSDAVVPITLSVSTTASPLPVSVQGNTIANFTMTGGASGTTTSAPFRAIFVSAGVASIGDINGNTIGSMSATGNISFASNSTSTGEFYGIFNNGSSAITINNNNIGGITTSNSSTGASVVYGIRVNTSSTVATTIISNTIGGTIANSINNTTNATGSLLHGIKNDVSNSTINTNIIRNLSIAGGTGVTTAASLCGISYASTASNNTCSGNTIHTLTNTHATAAVTVTGIQYTSSTGTNIVERNLIYNLVASSTGASSEINGIRVAGGTTTYKNNMIALGANVTTAVPINGFNEVTFGTDNFWHNSIYIGGTPTTGAGNSFAFNSLTVTNVRSYRDNIFVNARANSGATGKNYIIQVGGTAVNPAGLTVNNNLYFKSGSGTVFGRFNGADVAALSPDWKNAVGQDAASDESNPQFNDPTNAIPDLHIHPTNSTYAEANGFDLSVADDFDSQTRSSLTPTDIGADAGNFVGIDGVGPLITYTALGVGGVFSTRVINNFANITDNSGVNVTSGTKPRIYYKRSTDANAFNNNTSGTDGWKYVEASNGATPFSFTIDYSLLNGGTGVAVGQTIQYFVVAQDLASTPNVGINSGSFAAAQSSVALAGSAFPIGGSINSYAIVEFITGTKTVCPTGCDYASLTLANGAFDRINVALVTGNVDLKITADLTSETGAIALNEISGGFTLTITPSGGARSISGTSATGSSLIKLNTADNVTIDGSLAGTGNSICSPTHVDSRDLTITNNSTNATTAVIWIQSNGGNGATNNVIKNCNIVGNSNTTTLFGIGSGSSAAISLTNLGSGNNNNSFINNNVSKVQWGIYSAGASAGSKNSGNKINQNQLNTASPNNIQRGGIYVGFENNIEISANNIGSISQSSDAFGIGFGLTSWSATTATGNEVTNATVSKNVIGPVISTGSSSSAGILVCLAGSGTNAITNNMIFGVISNATTSDIVSGILVLGGAASTQIYYNTVEMSGARTGTSSGSSLALAIAGATPVVDIRNNILVNTQTSPGSGKSYAIGLGYASTTGNYSNLTSNHNNFYTGDASAFFSCVGGLNGGADKTTLAAWTAETGRDGSGTTLTIQPVFVSPTDLHINPSVGINGSLNDAAVTGTGINEDIDCDARTTDIGADEFAPLVPPTVVFNGMTPSTVANCTATARVVTVDVQPVAGTITSVTISYNNGSAAGPFAMTNTSGTIWSYTIPAENPSNAVVTWSVTAVNSGGGSTTLIGPSYQDNPLIISAFAHPNTVCSGATTILTANGGTTQARIGNATGTSVLGHPFRGASADGDYKQQLLIKASELNAAGVPSSRPISSVTYSVTAITTVSSQYIPNYTMRMGHTTSTLLTATFDIPSGGFTTVFNDNVTIIVGANTLYFSSPFVWDGTSNILIEVCYTLPANLPGSASFASNSPGFAGYTGRVGETDACNSAAGASTSTTRALMTFGYEPSNLSYVWSSGAGVVSTTNPGSAVVSGNTVYTVAVTNSNNGCTNTATASVTLSPTVQASNITGAPTTTTIPTPTLTWTNGDGIGRVVLMNTTGVFTPPANGTIPTASTAWVNAGTQCVYNGIGNYLTANITGLTNGTVYWFAVYEYACASNPVYLTTTATNNPKSLTTKAIPVITFNSNSAPSCTSSPISHTVAVNATTIQGTITGVTITYNNGTAAGPFAMTNTSGNIWSYSIPAASSATRNVSWTAVVTNSDGQTATLIGPQYNDFPTSGLSAIASSSSPSFCVGGTVDLVARIAGPPSFSPSAYCTLSSFLSTPSDDIGQVTFAGINNPSVRPTPQQSNGAAIGNQTDFSGSVAPAVVNTGSTYPMTVYWFSGDADADANFVNVYIDFNHDTIFDQTTERFSLTKPNNIYLEDFVGNITIPSTALPGITKMRVLLKEGSSISASCGILNYGEVEDYAIDIRVTPDISSGTYAWTGTIDGAVGTNNPQTVSPSAPQSYSASLTYTIAGCTIGLTTNSVSVAVDNSAPTIQASLITAGNGAMQLPLGWTIGNGDGRVVFMNTTNSFVDPVDGSNPTANSVWQNSGQQCVYSGTGNSVAITGLQPLTTYWFRVYEYRCENNKHFLVTTATDNPKSFTSGPTLAYNITRTRGISYNSILNTGSNLSWNPAFTSQHSGDDEFTFPMSLTSLVGGPCTFVYQGETVTSFMMSTNGWITFDPSIAVTPGADGTWLGRPTQKKTLAAFWDDLATNPNPASSIGAEDRLKACMKWQVFGSTAGSRQIVIEWSNMSSFSAPGHSLMFQIVLDETDNSIAFNYGLLQGFNGTINARYSYAVGLSGPFISSDFPKAGEVLAQQYENSNVFSHEFTNDFQNGVNSLMIVPECNSQIKFTNTGTYTPVIPTEELKNGLLDENNDESFGAITVTALPSFPTNLCGEFYNSRFATPSANATCVPNTGDIGNNDDDVWFIFNAQQPLTTVRVYGSGGYAPRVEVIDANTMTMIACASSTAGSTVDADLTNLVPFNDYYIRVYHDGGGTRATATANISGGAVTGFNMTNNGTGYTNTSQGDVKTARVTITGGGGSDAIGRAVVGNGQVTSIALESGGFGYTSAPTVTIEEPDWAQTGEFALVVFAISPNDNCDGALELTNLTNAACVVGQNSLDGQVTSSATYSTAEGAPSCGSASTADDDVWYKFTAIHTQTAINITGHVTYNPAFQVWDAGVAGTCATKTTTSADCYNASTGLNESATITTIVNHVYYIRVWHAASGGGGVGSYFDICISSGIPSCVSAPTSPANGGSACSTGFNLSWAPVAGATGYLVFASDGIVPFTQIANNVGNANTTVAIPSIPTGNYQWYVTPYNTIGAASGCPIFTATIVAPPSVFISPTPADARFCEGSGSSVTLQGNGATTYTWSPSTGLNVNTGSTVIANPTTTTTYTVNGTANTGCSAVAIQTVTVDPVPSAPSVTDYYVCLNGTIQPGEGLTANCTGTGGLNVNWYNTAGTTLYQTGSPFDPVHNDPQVSTSSVQNFQFVAKCSNLYCQGPGTTATLHVGAPFNVVATQALPSTHCSGLSDQLTATATGGGQPYSYSWSPTLGLNNPTIANPIANPSVNTVYTVTVSGACAPTTSSTVTINLTSSPSSTITRSAAGYCHTDSATATVTLTAAPGADTYSWQPTTGIIGSTGNVIVVQPTGTLSYVVTATNTSSGCYSTSSTVVTVGKDVLASASASPSNICFNGTTQLNSTSGVSANYSVTAINYVAPVPNNPTTITSFTNNDNDDGSAMIPLPYSFNFYGINYNQLWVGTNGYVSFSSLVGFSPTLLGVAQTFPNNTGAAIPRNMIAFNLGNHSVFSPGSVKYWTSGTDFIIFFDQIQQENTPINTSTGYIILHTADNSIDVLVTSSLYNTVHTLGIENIGSTLGIAPAGRNFANWTVTTPEAWHFAPNSSSLSYSWSPSTYLNSSTVANPVVSNFASTSTTYTVTVTDQVGGCSATASTTITSNPLTSVSLSSFNTYTAANYAFTAAGSGGSPIALTSPSRLVGDSVDQEVSSVVPIGFNFFFEGNQYSSFSVNSNELMRLGQTAVSTQGSNVITSNAEAPKLMPFWNDNTMGFDGGAFYEVQGTPGSRRLVVEWQYLIGTLDGATTNYTQVVLYEGTNVIEFRYGAGVSGGTHTIGIGGLLGANFVSVTSSAGGGTANNVTGNNNNSIYPGAGTLYTFTPPSGTTQICQGSSKTIFSSVIGGGLPLTYSWSPATGLNNTTGATVIASPSSTTSYVLTVKDFCNTIVSSSPHTIQVNPPPTILVSSTPSPAVICTNGSIQLTADGADSYTWAPATGLDFTFERIVNASPATTTTYTVSGNTNGCIGKTTVTVSVVPPIVITPTATPQSGCDPYSGQLHYSEVYSDHLLISEVVTFRNGSGATNPYPAYVGTADRDFIEITNVTGASVNISGWMFDDYSNGSSTSNHPYTFPSGTIIPSPGVLVLHLGVGTDDPSNHFYNTDGTTQMYQSTESMGFVLRNGSTIVDAVGCASGFAFSGLTGVTASDWTGFVTISTGAGASRNTYVDSNNETGWYSANASNLQTLGALNPGFTSVPTFSSYSWSPSANLSNANDANPLVSGLSSSTEFTVTVTNSQGCTGVGTVSVTVLPSPPAPTITPAGSTNFCSGGSVSLDATGSYVSYTWAPATGLNVTNAAVVVASPTVTTTYTVTGYSANGCGASSTVTITINNPAPATISWPGAPNPAALTFCQGFSVALTASGGYSSYAWSPSSGLNGTSGTSVTANAAGTYTVTVTNAFGCTASSSITVTVNPNPVAPTVSLVGTSPICDNPTGSVLLNATITGSGLTYLWNNFGGATTEDYTVNGDDQSFLFYSDPYGFELTVTEPSTGCSSISNTVTVATTPCGVVLNMKMYIQGFYNPSTGLMDPPTTPGSGCLFNLGMSANPNDVDYVMVTAIDENTLAPVESQTGTLKLNGDLSVTFMGPATAGNNYYLKVTHRNLIETWSKNPVLFLYTTTYDFTNAVTKAWDDGFNIPMKLVSSSPVRWAMFNGDIDQDGGVNSLDMTIEENDSNIGAFGYNASDLDGDAASGALDMTLIENNSNINVFTQHP